MKFLVSSILAFLFLFPDLSFSQSIDAGVNDTDKAIILDVISRFSEYKDLETGDLMIKIGINFYGSPYAANTLEINKEEKLVVNLREMDCTTFVENCLALARTIKNENADENSFITELMTIRYRNGLIERYPSRLHYFSDWIYDNEKKKIVKNVTAKSGGISKKNKVDFMSTHRDSYFALKIHPEFIIEIAKQEKTISKRQFKYIPKKQLTKYEKNIKNGDIIGISTDIAGMDIQHVAIASWNNNKLHILHASQTEGKVILSKEPICEYLLNNNKATGIVIARPN